MRREFWNAEAVRRVAEEALRAAVTVKMDEVYAVSQRIVPLNKEDMAHRGTLKRSGRIKQALDAVEISYSVDEPFDYARLQHDVTWFEHLPGRTHHYLSKPFGAIVGDRVLTPRAKTYIEGSVRRALRRRGR